MSRARAALAVAVIAVGFGVALLWDPTVCISPAFYKCAGRACPPPQVYCSHEYVPLRLGLALLALLVGILILMRHRRTHVLEAAR